MLAILAAVKLAIRTYRLYPREHPLVESSVTEVLRVLGPFLERHASLELQIRREGVAHMGELVAPEAGLTNDLSFLLYPEGVRSLTLDRGVDAGEVHQLVETLAGRDGTNERDLLGALWRRELRCIRYQIYEPLSPAAVRAPQDPTLVPIARRIADVTSWLDRSNVEREATYARHLGKAAGLRPPEDPAAAALRAELAAALRDEDGTDVVRRAALASGWAATSEDHAPDPLDVAHFAAGTVTNALWRGELERAAFVLTTARTAGEPHPLLAERLTSPEGISLVSRALHGAFAEPARAATAREAGTAFLEALGPMGMEQVAELHGRTVEAGVKDLLRAHLLGLATERPEPLAAVTAHRDEPVAASALELLVAAIAAPKVRAVLQRFAEDGALPWRQRRAVEVLEQASGDADRRRWLATLDTGTDRAARLEAAKQLAQRGNARTYDQLAAHVQKREFVQRDEEEQNAVLEALTRLGGVRSVRVLQELSDKKGVLARKETVRLAATAGQWLERLKKGKPGP